jgi:cytochrome c oxidase subunit 2
MVAGYQPIMPTFQGLISEEGLLQLVAYIRSLTPPAKAPGASTTPSAAPMAPPVNNNPPPQREAPK